MVTRRMALIIKGTKGTLSIPVDSEIYNSEEKSVYRGTLSDREQDLLSWLPWGTGRLRKQTSTLGAEK